MMSMQIKPQDLEFQNNNQPKCQHQQPKEKKSLDEDENKTKNRTRRPFSKKEDETLLELVGVYGTFDHNCWYAISYHMKDRSPRQCRERYQLFLSNGMKKKIKWTKDEDRLLLSKYETLGPRWKMMESFFDGRNSYSIKNRFVSLNRHKRKRENLNANCSNDDYLNYLDNDFQLKLDLDEPNQLEFYSYEEDFNIFK